MYQVFISYRRKGGIDLAYLLFDKLTASGYNVFFDIDSLGSGKFDERIINVIDECPNFLLICTPGCLDRCGDDDDWVRREVATALQKGKNIIPIMTEDFAWPDNLPEEMAAVPSFNAVTVSYHYFSGVVKKIAESLVERPLGLQGNAALEGRSLEHVLLWGDFGSGIVEKLIKRMKLPEQYYVESLVSPSELLSKSLSQVSTIVLICTDVTKLAPSDAIGIAINEALGRFVGAGGRLVGTHDLIYRRTRNEVLQEMFGCKIVNFQAAESTTYVKTEECKDLALFEDLPDEFVLHDGEICWGKLSPDVEVLFEDPEGHPLVFIREYGRGVCVYLNSGDYKDTAPYSILKPERPFVDLVHSAIMTPTDFADAL